MYVWLDGWMNGFVSSRILCVLTVCGSAIPLCCFFLYVYLIGFHTNSLTFECTVWLANGYINSGLTNGLRWSSSVWCFDFVSSSTAVLLTYWLYKWTVGGFANRLTNGLTGLLGGWLGARLTSLLTDRMTDYRISARSGRGFGWWGIWTYVISLHQRLNSSDADGHLSMADTFPLHLFGGLSLTVLRFCDRWMRLCIALFGLFCFILWMLPIVLFIFTGLLWHLLPFDLILSLV